jgi:hypothetical protein
MKSTVVRRDEKGQFKESVDADYSLSADKRALGRVDSWDSQG